MTRKDKTGNDYIRESLKMALETKKMRSRLAWFGHVNPWEECHMTGRVIEMNVKGYKDRGRQKNR